MHGGSGESGIRHRHKPVKSKHYETHKKDKKSGDFPAPFCFMWLFPLMEDFHGYANGAI
jgi:hypothetical protein